MDNSFIKKPTQDNFITEKVDIYKNNLLGEYDDNGNYSIAPQIVQELIDLTKVKKNSYDNSIFCFGNLLGYGEIAFELSFEKNRDSENRATASLYVLEGVDKVNGYLQNTIKTKLADFISNVSDFIEQSYAKFHVINEGDEDEGREKKTLDELELDDSYILAKRAYMLLLDKLSSEKMLDAYGKYFTARLTNLTKLDNEFSNAVLDSFNQKYELIEDIFLKEKNYKALNELLDSCIEGISGTKEIYITQENAFNEIMSEYLNAFTDSVNKLNDKAEQKAFGLLEPDDRNKMDQMNATFENPNGNNELRIEEIDDSIDNAQDVENSIDDSFQNPVLDAVEEEIAEVEEPVSANSQTDENSQADENLQAGDNEQKSEEIEPAPNEEIPQSSENAQPLENPQPQEAPQTDEMVNNEQGKDNLISRILSMQGDGASMEENNASTAEPAQEEPTQEEIHQEEHVENEISEEYVSSNADFQKSRQNDRLNNITDRLSKLSEVSENVAKENIQPENIQPENTQSENISAEVQKNNDTHTFGDNNSDKLNKDRFSALFNYLEKKQDEEVMDNEDDFTR